jgi:hypothetical protein
MNILVNGASISRGPDTWPYFLKDLLKCELVNLAMAGCGNTYIHETTISEISQRKYDLVLVMWAECGRMDFRVDDISKFSDSHNTSIYQSAQNDWPSKIVYPIDDQDYVEKNWIFSLGSLRGTKDSVSEIFQPCHAVTGHKEILKSEYIRMISLQSVLKENNIPYMFMHWRPIRKFSRFEHLYNLIDWSNVYQEDCLEDIAQRNNWIAEDGKHPNTDGHRYYANLLYQRIIFEILKSPVDKGNPGGSISVE